MFFVPDHQNNYDLFTVSNAVQPGTVSVGKQSLKWIPFFGQMYWLTGNILIDRKNTSKAMGTIALTAEKIQEKGLSVWLFPEGTRVKAGRVGKYARSGFELAKRNNVKILPLCHNSGDCWPAHKFIKKSGIINLHIGKPFFVEDSKESAEEVQQWVESKLNTS